MTSAELRASRLCLANPDCRCVSFIRTLYSCGYKLWNRELTLMCKLKSYVKPMKDPLGVSPSKGNQGTTRGKEKIILTSIGIEPTTFGLDLPLLCRLSYERLRW